MSTAIGDPQNHISVKTAVIIIPMIIIIIMKNNKQTMIKATGYY
jgi:hypothetical protein